MRLHCPRSSFSVLLLTRGGVACELHAVPAQPVAVCRPPAPAFGDRQCPGPRSWSWWARGKGWAPGVRPWAPSFLLKDVSLCPSPSQSGPRPVSWSLGCGESPFPAPTPSQSHAPTWSPGPGGTHRQPPVHFSSSPSLHVPRPRHSSSDSIAARLVLWVTRVTVWERRHVGPACTPPELSPTEPAVWWRHSLSACVDSTGPGGLGALQAPLQRCSPPEATPVPLVPQSCFPRPVEPLDPFLFLFVESRPCQTCAGSFHVCERE